MRIKKKNAKKIRNQKEGGRKGGKERSEAKAEEKNMLKNTSSCLVNES